MAVLRFLGNIIVVVVTLCLIVALLVAGWGVAMARTWEYESLDYAAAGESEPQLGWLWIEGQPIAYRQWGVRPEGEPLSGAIVLVHGLQVEGGETWAPVARALARQGTPVFAVDLYGMGRTTREAPSAAYTVRAQANLLATALNELRVGQATVVAVDWGCAVALQMAYEQPQFARQLVLLAPRLEGPWTVWHQRVAQVPYLNRAAAWLAYGGGPIWELLQRRDLAEGAAASEYLKRARRTTHIVGTLDALVAMALAPADSDLPEALARIQAPTLILAAEHDPYVPLASAQALRAALPAARLESLAKAGHHAQVTHSAEVARHVLALQR